MTNDDPTTAAPLPETEGTDRLRRDFLKFGALAASGSLLGACRDETPSARSQLPPQLPPPPPQVSLPITTFNMTPSILSEPMLQNPGADSVRVVWFSEVADGRHRVFVGANNERVFEAMTTPMTRLAEDRDSQVFQRITSELARPELRRIFRHEAVVTGLTPGERVPYVAVSEFGGNAFRSTITATLQPLPRPGQNVRLLLSSDQQNNRMCAANYQKVQETVGTVDAVLFPGDFVSQPNRASEWFDRVSINNPSFFQSLQGTMQRWNPGSPFRGGEILQFAALYGCVGNHEYPGRWRLDPLTDDPGNTGPVTINAMDNDPQPRWYAELRYERLKATINPTNDPAFRERWIEDNSFEFRTYREMWSLPEGPEGKAYWAQRYGDIFLISLDANRIWRTWNANQRGKFTENFNNAAGRLFDNPSDWGFGDFTFRPFGRGSRQYEWLQQVLASEACRSARFRIVLTHQTPFGLGDNAVPVQAMQRVTVELTDGGLIGPFPASEWPQRWLELEPRLRAGQVRYVRYEYPLADDIWRNDIEPLLLAAGVHLVHCGHSHLWNRSRVGNLHYIETANVGNSFGAMFFNTPRPGVSPSQGPRPTQPGNASWLGATVTSTPPRTTLTWNPADYPVSGDPHARPMIQPSIFNPMRELAGAAEDLPFIASNVLTAFTIFESGTGTVASYVYDTRAIDGPVRKFDEFQIG
ncbi:MAG: hypothetical protein SNJ63_10415 [Sphingomonadaceae bacterium]